MACALAISVLSMEGRNKAADAERMEMQLADIKTAQDSLRLVYDIFDASTQAHKAKWGWLLMDLAERTDNQAALRDMAPRMATIMRKDTTAFNKILEYVALIKDEEHRKAIATFIKMNRISEEANYLTEKERKQLMLKYATENSNSGDLYDNIFDLYRLVAFVGIGARGNLYLEYLERMEKLIDQVPDDCYYMKNLFYTGAALAHTQNGNFEKAIEADRKLINIISHLEDRAEAQGREYRDYDRYYYISYRRMLSNYEGLTPEETEAYYEKCKQLADKDTEVANDFNGEGRPTIYRLMAIKEYAEAVPLLKHAIRYNQKKRHSNNKIYRDLLGMLVTASAATGDNETLLKALQEYNSELEQALRSQSTEAYRELQTRYEVSSLREQRDKSEMERKDMELATRQRVLAVALGASLLFIVLLMVIYRKNFTLRHKVKEMRRENVKLHRRIDELLSNGNPEGTENLKP